MSRGDGRKELQNRRGGQIPPPQRPEGASPSPGQADPTDPPPQAQGDQGGPDTPPPPVGWRHGDRWESRIRLLSPHMRWLKRRAKADQATYGEISIDVIAAHVDQLRAGAGVELVPRPGGAPPRQRSRRRSPAGRADTAAKWTEAEALWLGALVVETGRGVSDLLDTAIGLAIAAEQTDP